MGRSRGLPPVLYESPNPPKEIHIEKARDWLDGPSHDPTVC